MAHLVYPYFIGDQPVLNGREAQLLYGVRLHFSAPVSAALAMSAPCRSDYGVGSRHASTQAFGAMESAGAGHAASAHCRPLFGESAKHARRILPFLALSGLLGLAGCDALVSPEARLEKAEALAKGDSGTAGIELRKLIQKEPGHTEARMILARLSLKLGDPAAAEARDRARISAEVRWKARPPPSPPSRIICR